MWPDGAIIYTWTWHCRDCGLQPRPTYPDQYWEADGSGPFCFQCWSARWVVIDPVFQLNIHAS